MAHISDDDLNAFFTGLDSKQDELDSRSPHRRIAEDEGLRDVYTGERHSCFECNGTGLYQGVRLHQEKQHCFACKGKGWFKKSYADRQKSKQQSTARKAAKLEAIKAAFEEQHPGLIETLRSIAGWHNIAGSMIQGFDKYGALTEKQVPLAMKIAIGTRERQAQRAAEREKNSGEVSVEAIETMFRTARSNGLKRPKFIAERLTISLAPDHGRNAGSLYVKCDGEYAGKITSGRLYPTREAPADILAIVREIAANPIEAARMYGRKTGTCCCCGRELTDKTSIENGIGPICESKWF